MKTSVKIVLRIFVLAGLVGALYLIADDVFQKRVTLPIELEHFLENADEFTLFSVAPEEHFLDSVAPDERDPSTNLFQGHLILGQIEVKSLVTRTNLIAALNAGIAAKNRTYIPGTVPALPDCFNPRHAIRAKKGNETVELLICFECSQIYVTSRSITNQLFMTTGDPAAIFNKVLKNADVPLSKN